MFCSSALFGGGDFLSQLRLERLFLRNPYKLPTGGDSRTPTSLRSPKERGISS